MPLHIRVSRVSLASRGRSLAVLSALDDSGSRRYATTKPKPGEGDHTERDEPVAVEANKSESGVSIRPALQRFVLGCEHVPEVREVDGHEEVFDRDAKSLGHA